MRKIALLTVLLPLLTGCIATARAETKTLVDWKSECSDPCKKPYVVTMYRQDGTVETLRVAVNSVTQLIGCYCPAPTPASDKPVEKK